MTSTNGLSADHTSFLENRLSAADGRGKVELLKQEKHEIWAQYEKQYEELTKRKDALSGWRRRVWDAIEANGAEVQTTSELILNRAIEKFLEGEDLMFQGAEVLDKTERELRLLKGTITQLEKIERENTKTLLEAEISRQNAKGAYAISKAELLEWDLLVSLEPAIRLNNGLTFSLDSQEIAGFREAARLARREAASASKTLEEIRRSEQNAR